MNASAVAPLARRKAALVLRRPSSTAGRIPARETREEDGPSAIWTATAEAAIVRGADMMSEHIDMIAGAPERRALRCRCDADRRMPVSVRVAGHDWKLTSPDPRRDVRLVAVTITLMGD